MILEIKKHIILTMEFPQKSVVNEGKIENIEIEDFEKISNTKTYLIGRRTKMIDHDKYVANYRPPKKDKKIKLSVSAAKEIIENLSDTGLENDLKELLQEQLDKHNREIRHIRAIEYCDHEWHTFTKEEAYKFGSPKTWKIEDRGSEFIEEFYMFRFGYCEKCKMPYKFYIFTDEDFERIVDEYESEDVITLGAYNSSSIDIFDRLFEKKINH